MSTLNAVDTEIINIARSIRVYAMKANCDLPVGDPSDRDLDRVLFHQRQSLEKLTGVDLPDDQLKPLVDGIKAKLAASDLGSKLDGLKKLF